MSGPALARARRVWRRCGVRRADRGALADELAGEIEAAAADGYDPESVLGDDVGATARTWALERGLAGRSLQAATMLWVVLVGVLLGSSTMIAVVAVTFLASSCGEDFLTPSAVTAVTFASSAVMAVLLPVLGTWAVLHHRRDPRAGASARWLALLLPAGGMVGLLLAVVAGVALQDHEVVAFPLMGALFLASCAGSGLLARHLSVRFAPIPR